MKTIMDASAIQRAITRITYEILERNHGADQLAVIGIYSRGVILAERIVERIAELEHRQVELGALDITTYRDDKVVPNHAEKTKLIFLCRIKKSFWWMMSFIRAEAAVLPWMPFWNGADPPAFSLRC